MTTGGLRAWVAGAVLAACAALGCGDTPPMAADPPGGSGEVDAAPARAAGRTDTIAWSVDSTAVLVGARWVYALEKRELRPLPVPDDLRDPIWTADPGPDGETTLWFDGGAQLRITRALAPGVEALRIPDWLPPSLREPRVRNVPYWGSARRILVHQLDPDPASRAPEACGAYDLDARQWQKLRDGGCVEASFFFVWKIQSRPGRFLAAFSGGEGKNALDVWADAPFEPGPRAPTTTYDTDSFSPRQLALGERDARLLFPCRVERDTEDGAQGCPPSASPDEDDWSVQRWDLETGDLEPIAEALPASARLAPSGEAVAWLTGDSLCVRDLSSGIDACVEVPAP